MNLIFLVLVLMLRISKADFLQEEMSRIVKFFSYTFLCNSNQDPTQELWILKTWQLNKLV